MRPYTLILFLGILCFSCQKQDEKLRIDPETLVIVLADVHIAEGAVLAIKPSHKDSIRNFYYHQIYEIHGVEAAAFEHDIEVLKQNPKMLEFIYEKVSKELDQRSKDLKSKDSEK